MLQESQQEITDQCKNRSMRLQARGRRAARQTGACRPADDELRLEQELVAGSPAAVDLAEERATAAWPIASIGWRTVVSGGSVKIISAESSKPTTETSPGTASPARRAGRIAPRARRSLAQTTPVAPRPSSRVAAAVATLEREDRVLDQVVVELVARAPRGTPAELADRRHVIRGPEHEADALVPERHQMASACSMAMRVVDGDAGEAEVVVGRVDEHDRQVPGRRGGGSGVVGVRPRGTGRRRR